MSDVLQCPLCASESAMLESQLSDYFFAYPGHWDVRRCLDSGCAIAWNANPLNDDMLAEAYGRYYTHDAAHPSAIEVGMGKWINGRIARHHDRFPAVPLLFREAENRLLDGGAIPALPHGVAVDVGCGSGERIDYYRALGWGHALGVDPDPVAVGCGQQAGCKIAQGAAEAISLTDESVDAIFLHHVVEHLADIRPAIREAWRVLKPGGHIVITTPNLDAEGRQEWQKYWRGYEAPRHLRLYTLQALRKVVAEGGFAIRHARTSARAAPFMDRESARVAGTRTRTSPFGWWREDRKILALQRRIAAGEQVGEEIFIVGTRL